MTSPIVRVELYPPVERSKVLAYAKITLVLGGHAVVFDNFRVLPATRETKYHVAPPSVRLFNGSDSWTFVPVIVLDQPLKQIVRTAIITEFERWRAAEPDCKFAAVTTEVSNGNA